MSPHPENEAASRTGSGLSEAETTLRLIAGLPAPDGLEERVKTALHQSVHRVAHRRTPLHWPLAPHLNASPKSLRPGTSSAGWLQNTWARSVAAAAIVFVVAGGGWEVYSRVQPAEQPKAIALPPVPAHGGSFSSANAIRKPRTLDGTVLTHPLAAPAHPGVVTVKKPANPASKPIKNNKAEATKTAAP